MASPLVATHVRISGTVQGVAFRAYTRQTALDLKVNGWVRNLRDGRVEAVFEGAESAVTNMVQWCYRGSPAAVVTDVQTTEIQVNDMHGFDIQPTV